jgi:regulator of RNase E activity RraA
LRIEPGDFVVADINGIIGIALSQLEKALERALEIVRKEEEMSRQIDSGRTIFEVLRLDDAIP